MSPANDLKSVVSDPQWLASRYDWQRATVDFEFISREKHRQLSFLSDEYIKEIAPGVRTAGLTEIAAAAASLDGAPHYIFHSAFCCSTLLARALDAPGVSMSLNEPQAVNHLALAALQNRLQSDVLTLLVRLLGRPFGPDEAVIVKPGNEANVVAGSLMEADSRSRAIFLYAPLPRFLASVANKGMWGRIWARRVVATLRAYGGLQLGLGDNELFQLTDLQVAALAWLTHHAQGAALFAAFPDRVRTLDSETFLAHRTDTLGALGHHFGIALDARSVSDGPVFQTHSKEIGRAMDPEGPLEPKPQIPTVHEEIEMVEKWAQAVAASAGMKYALPPESALIRPA